MSKSVLRPRVPTIVILARHATCGDSSKEAYHFQVEVRFAASAGSGQGFSEPAA
jgi:hypothetical protein